MVGSEQAKPGRVPVWRAVMDVIRHVSSVEGESVDQAAMGRAVAVKKGQGPRRSMDIKDQGALGLQAFPRIQGQESTFEPGYAPIWRTDRFGFAQEPGLPHHSAAQAPSPREVGGRGPRFRRSDLAQ